MLTLKYYGMEGTGRNVTEAKKNAGHKIEKALSGDYTPLILVWRDHAYLVYRDPESGWRSRLIADDESGICAGPVWGTISPDGDDKNKIVADCKLHLAQLGWEENDGKEPPTILPNSHHGDFIEWAEFQLRYKEARRRGMSDNDAHSYALRNPQRPELWKEEEKV
jgi:hypothetical protein